MEEPTREEAGRGQQNQKPKVQDSLEARYKLLTAPCPAGSPDGPQGWFIRC